MKEKLVFYKFYSWNEKKEVIRGVEENFCGNKTSMHKKARNMKAIHTNGNRMERERTHHILFCKCKRMLNFDNLIFPKQCTQIIRNL